MPLQIKSDNNLLSAQNLLDAELYSSSVHCSYYSCFQTAVTKYISLSQKKYFDVQQEIQDNNKFVHSYYINKLLGMYLNNSKDVNRFSERKRMKNLYKNLKELRIDADYNDIVISKENATQAIKNCKTLNDWINSIP